MTEVGEAIEPLQHFANAELFYGIAWDPEFIDGRQAEHLPPVLGLADGDDGGWWRTMLLAEGHMDPWMTAPDPETFDPEAQYIEAFRSWRDSHEQEIDAWRMAARAIQDKYGVDVGWHGSALGDGTRYPHLFIVGSVHSASQWEAKPIPQGALEEVEEEWDEQIARFCDDLQVVTEGSSGACWLLTAGLS